MRKAEMEVAREVYLKQIGLATSALHCGSCIEALSHAKSAWAYVEGMMRYEMRYEDAEFDSLRCVELVLSLAPIVFDFEGLNQLEDLLHDRKWIEKKTETDLGDQVVQARLLMTNVCQLWESIEEEPGIQESQALSYIDADPATSSELLQKLIDVGVVSCVEHEGVNRLALRTDLAARCEAKCGFCGTIVSAPKRRLLSPQPCPGCGREETFVFRSSNTESSE